MKMLFKMLKRSVAVSPYRSVIMQSRVPSGITTAGSYLGITGKEHVVIGSGDVSELKIVLNNWAMGSNSSTGVYLPTGNTTIVEMWVTKEGDATGIRVTWGGVNTKVLAPGDYDVVSDMLTPENFGFIGYIPIGTRFYIGYKAEVSNSTHSFATAAYDHNKTGNSTIIYTPGTSTITNLQGSSDLAWDVSVAGNSETSLPIIMIGKFVGGDKPVFAAIGDSITFGSSDNDILTGPTKLYGWFERALVDNETTFSNPRAGINFGVSGGSASAWDIGAPNGSRTKLLSALKYANNYVERYGINDISWAGDQGTANSIRAERKIIWDLCKTMTQPGGNAPYVIALPLTPKTNNTYTTLGDQTPVSGLGGTQEYLDADIAFVSGTANGPDDFIENTTSLRGSTNKSNADYWRWNVTPRCSNDGDGAHPNVEGHSRMAVAVRSWMAAR